MALALYRHSDALIVEHPDIIVPNGGVFLSENRRLVYAAELGSALGSVKQIALAGEKQLVAVFISRPAPRSLFSDRSFLRLSWHSLRWIFANCITICICLQVEKAGSGLGAADI